MGQFAQGLQDKGRMSEAKHLPSSLSVPRKMPIWNKVQGCASLVQTMRPGDRLGKVPTIASAVWRGAPNTTPVGYALATVTSSKLQSLLVDLGECVSGLAPVT